MAPLPVCRRIRAISASGAACSSSQIEAKAAGAFASPRRRIAWNSTASPSTSIRTCMVCGLTLDMGGNWKAQPFGQPLDERVGALRKSRRPLGIPSTEGLAAYAAHSLSRFAITQHAASHNPRSLRLLTESFMFLKMVSVCCWSSFVNLTTCLLDAGVANICATANTDSLAVVAEGFAAQMAPGSSMRFEIEPSARSFGEISAGQASLFFITCMPTSERAWTTNSEQKNSCTRIFF